MNRTRSSAILCVVALGIAAACGGDDSTTSVTGLPAEQRLSELSDQDAQQACRGLNSHAKASISEDSIKRVSCLVVTVQTTYRSNLESGQEDVNKCKQLVDACAAMADASTEEEDDCDEARATDINDCSATVGEWEDCFRGFLNQLKTVIASMTCENAEEVATSSYNDELDPLKIPACTSLRQKCPDSELAVPFDDASEAILRPQD